MTQEQLAHSAAEQRANDTATIPLREPLRFGEVTSQTPLQLFRFVGAGPFYEFRADGAGVTPAQALNFFRQIGARVVIHDRRYWVFQEDGSKIWYDYFLVEWHQTEGAAP